ncbi:hypothetical protein BsWGS_25368 [Bradybaena similaris]
MLLNRHRYCRISCLALLVVCFEFCDSAWIRTERNTNGHPTNETISLPDTFRMMLSLKGGVNEFPANVWFNKTMFEKFYGCLCQQNAYSCSGNLSYDYYAAYSYNTESINMVPTDTVADMSSKYKCEIPNFGYLSNNRGGYFSCSRLYSTESACTVPYWAIYIGQCDLDFAKVVWDESREASWNYTSIRSKSKRNLISSCACDANGASSCDGTAKVTPTTIVTSTAIVTPTLPKDNVTTHVFTSTTNSTNERLKESSNAAAVIGGTVSVVVVLAAVLVVGVIWRCRKLRNKNNANKDINKLTSNEQTTKDNRRLPPQIPTRVINGNAAHLFVIPERGLKPETEFPKWNHSRRKEEDDTTSGVYDVIGSGVYENDISANGSTRNFNNRNNSDETFIANKQITNGISNNKNPFGNSNNSDSKNFNLTVTNSDYVPGISKLGTKDSNVHNSHNNLLKPPQDIRQRQRQPIPTDDSTQGSHDSTGQDSTSAYSVGRHFHENYNFLNRPADALRIPTTNNYLDVPTGAINRGQNSTVSSEVYPLHSDEYGSDGTSYYKLDKDVFPSADFTDSGGTLTAQIGFHDSFFDPRYSQ